MSTSPTKNAYMQQLAELASTSATPKDYYHAITGNKIEAECLCEGRCGCWLQFARLNPQTPHWLRLLIGQHGADWPDAEPKVRNRILDFTLRHENFDQWLHFLLHETGRDADHFWKAIALCTLSEEERKLLANYEQILPREAEPQPVA